MKPNEYIWYSVKRNLANTTSRQDMPREWVESMVADYVALEAERDRLAAELEQWKTWGIIEVAIRNPSVAEYMRHWEGRTEKAEADARRLRAALVKYGKHDLNVCYAGVRQVQSACTCGFDAALRAAAAAPALSSSEPVTNEELP